MSIGITVSLLGTAVGHFVYLCSYKKHLKSIKDKVEEEVNEEKSSTSKKHVIVSTRSSQSNIDESPSFSKSASFFELSKEDTEASNSTVPAWTSLGLEQPLVIAMVGLPARGKSYLVKMVMRYLKWTGFEAKVFNVGSYRRQVKALTSCAYIIKLTYLTKLDWISIC